MAQIEPAFGHLASQALLTGLELGIFHRLAGGPATAAALARSARSDRRATRMLLDALVGLGLLERRDGDYALPAAVLDFLTCPGVESDAFFDATREHLTRLRGDWSRLTDVVRTGRPVNRLGTPTEGAPLFALLVRRLFPPNYRTAQQLLRALPARFRNRPLDVLDVAAGSAAWSMPFAEAHPATRVTALDFGPVLAVARHFARACGVEDQLTFRAGDLRRVRLGREAYDVAILGHICHSEGAAGTRRLFRKVHQTLRPGGLMLVAEMIPDEKRCGADGGAHALLFALNMLVHTERGDTFTVSEYRQWAMAAGFRRFRAVPAGPARILSFQE